MISPLPSQQSLSRRGAELAGTGAAINPNLFRDCIKADLKKTVEIVKVMILCE